MTIFSLLTNVPVKVLWLKDEHDVTYPGVSLNV